MEVLQEPSVGDPRPCPYLPGREARMEHFFAREVTAAEMDALLAAGWRKFGISFFRPACDGCRECVPIRVPVARFVPSRSQRRAARAASAIEVSFKPLECTREAYAVYLDHGRWRFGAEHDARHFVESFYLNACPALQSEYRIDGALAGVGFLDRSERALSSVYFAFRASAARYRLGVVSVLAEIAHAASLGLDFYYLGYRVAGNPSMAYKAAFGPHELYDWDMGQWREPACLKSEGIR